MSDERDVARHAAILRWLARERPPMIALICAESEPEAGTTVQFHDCLARMPPAWIAELAVATEVRILVEGCSAPGAVSARLAFLTAITPRITLADHPPSGTTRVTTYRHAPADRRGLLGLQTGDAAGGDEHTSHDRLVAALRSLPRHGDAAGVALRLIAGGCTACGVCVRACPGGALEVHHHADVSLLVHHVDACEGSSICLALCPVGALSVAGVHPWSAALDGSSVRLTRVITSTCARCRNRFPGGSGETLCPVCRDWADRPFTSRLAPAAEALLHRRRGSGQPPVPPG